MLELNYNRFTIISFPKPFALLKGHCHEIFDSHFFIRRSPTLALSSHHYLAEMVDKKTDFRGVYDITEFVTKSLYMFFQVQVSLR
jgi:hypothetical protein